MKNKSKYVDQFKLTGDLEKDVQIAKERFEKLKAGDLSSLGYGVKLTLKFKIEKWLKNKIQMLKNKVQKHQQNFKQ